MRHEDGPNRSKRHYSVTPYREAEDDRDEHGAPPVRPGCAPEYAPAEPGGTDAGTPPETPHPPKGGGVPGRTRQATAPPDAGRTADSNPDLFDERSRCEQAQRTRASRKRLRLSLRFPLTSQKKKPRGRVQGGDEVSALLPQPGGFEGVAEPRARHARTAAAAALLMAYEGRDGPSSRSDEGAGVVVTGSWPTNADKPTSARPTAAPIPTTPASGSGQSPVTTAHTHPARTASSPTTAISHPKHPRMTDGFDACGSSRSTRPHRIRRAGA